MNSKPIKVYIWFKSVHVIDEWDGYNLKLYCLIQLFFIDPVLFEVAPSCLDITDLVWAYETFDQTAARKNWYP